MLVLTATNQITIHSILRGAVFGASNSVSQYFKSGLFNINPDGQISISLNDHTKMYGKCVIEESRNNFHDITASDTECIHSIYATITESNVDTFLLDAVYVYDSNPQQIVTFSQRLHRNTDSTHFNKTVVPEKPEGKNLRKANPESIQTPLEFEIIIEGKTEIGPFGPMKGILLITGPDEDANLPIFLTLAGDLPFQGENGWIVLCTDSAGKREPNTTIKVEKNKVIMHLGPSQDMRFSNFTLEKKDGVMSVAAIQTATLVLTIDGDTVSGTVTTSGYRLPDSDHKYLSDFKHESTYEAQITGKIRKNEIVESLKKVVETKFDGNWETTDGRFIKFELDSSKNNVEGRFYGLLEGRITGNINGNRLEFSLLNDNGKSEGNGFFLPILNGGLLVGKIYTPKGNIDILASRKLISISDIESLPPYELYEIKSFGQELALANRWDEASILLEDVVRVYSSCLTGHTNILNQKAIDSEDQKVQMAAGAQLSLVFLANCHFKLGNYQGLLRSMDYAMACLKFLSPEQSASRLFKKCIVKIIERLKAREEMCSSMEIGYLCRIELINESKGLTGICFNEIDEKYQILSIDKGSPADLAGIKVNDEISRINGIEIHGKSIEQVTNLISGKPKTELNIEIIRKGNKKSFKIIREKLDIGTASRQKKIAGELYWYYESLLNFKKMNAEFSEGVKDVIYQISTGKKSPLEEVEHFKREIESIMVILSDEVDSCIQHMNEIFINNKNEIEIVRKIVKNLESPKKINTQVELDSLEKGVLNRIDIATNLTPFEKKLFGAIYSDIISNRIMYSMSLKSDKEFFDKFNFKVLFEQDLVRSREITANLTDQLESWRIRLIKDIDKIQALDQGQQFFRNAIEFLLTLGRYEDALVASEKSRARAFADRLAFRQEQINKVTQEHIASKNTGIAINANPISINDLKNTVKKNKSTVIEYFLSDDKLTTWVISEYGEIQTVSTAIISQDLENKINHLQNLLNSEKQYEHERVATITILHELYVVLIRPIEKYLPSLQEEVVVFIPHKSLFAVPFAALVSKLPSKQDQPPHYLIEKHTISYSTSISILNYSNNTQSGLNSNKEKNILAIVNPTGSLCKTESEFNYIAQAFTSTNETIILENKKAKIGALIGIMKNRQYYKCIYFGTHGHSDTDESYIEMADGRLEIAAVEKLGLRTDLVVLSACETGKGKITGDGIYGISRAFACAGAPALLLNLWSVPEEQTLCQIVNFTELWIKKGNTKAQALRSAQLGIMKEYPFQPSVWAGLLLTGNHF